MKRILLVLMSLISVFFIVWGVKAKTPINRPSNIEETKETAWYDNRYTAPKAEEEWYLDPEVPLNYIPVPGEDELYMVVDDSGNIIGYRHRIKQADGSWVWEDVNPDIPDDYEKVEGLENIYKITDENGKVSYVMYVRNSDDTFCFVPVNEDGTPLDDGKNAEKITDDYVHVDGNVYAVYNDDNVKMGYRERVKQSDGSYIWKVCNPPEIDKSVGNGLGSLSNKEHSNSSSNQIGQDTSHSPEKTQNKDGTYTVTEKNTTTETKNGYVYTYQTTVYKTYDKNGKLLNTKKEGPYEIGKKQASNSAKPDKSQIAGSLSSELSRVSAKISFNTTKANELLNKLNAERKSQGLSALKMNQNSEAYQLACIRAADMAIYDHASSVSPMYGALADLIARYQCSSSHPSENIWKASTKSAAQIHTRFQANEDSRKIRMSDYQEVGIAIVESNGQTYVAEIYLK